MLIVVMVMMMLVLILVLVMMMIMMEIDGLARLDDFHHEIGLHVIPGRGDDPGAGMGFLDEQAALFHTVRRQQLRAAEDDGGGGLYLVQEEFAEVFHVHAAFACIHDGGAAADLEFGMTLFSIPDGGNDFAQLADTGGLDDDAVRMILVQQVIDGLLEIAGQGAADAAGIELGDGDAGILHKGAVHADFAVFVFKKNHFFVFQASHQQLADQSGLSSAEETGNEINLCHFSRSFSLGYGYPYPPGL